MAAVATLLGLLLVVTFIANFLTTVVPNQMQVNDLNHEVEVEAQFSRLAALFASATAQGKVGMQIVQPITLGSASVAPWVGQDGAFLGGARNGSTVQLSYGLLGTENYEPPTGVPASKAIPPGCTSVSPPSQLTCTGSSNFVYNLNTNSGVIAVSLSGSGNGALNITGNNSLVSLSKTGSGTLFVRMLGNHDTVFMNGTGSGATTIVLVGSNDTYNIQTVGSAPINILIVGNHDAVNFPGMTGSGPVVASVYGTNDTVTIPSSTGSGDIGVYLNGFNPSNATSSSCPYGNLSSYDSIGSVSHTGSGTVSFTVNNTVDYNANTTGSWGGPIRYQDVTPSTCPFFSRQQISIQGPSVVGTGPALYFQNLYAPSGEVAVDAGAVVFAQFGAYPVFVQKPAIALTENASGNVTAGRVSIPYFQNLVGSVAGVGTQSLDFRLLQSSSFVLNNSSAYYALDPSVPVTISITTPFAEAWDNYLNGAPLFEDLWSCAPVKVCTGVFTQAEPLGTITITIPTNSLVAFRTSSATFSFSLT